MTFNFTANKHRQN